MSQKTVLLAQIPHLTLWCVPPRSSYHPWHCTFSILWQDHRSIAHKIHRDKTRATSLLPSATTQYSWIFYLASHPSVWGKGRSHKGQGQENMGDELTAQSPILQTWLVSWWKCVEGHCPGVKGMICSPHCCGCRGGGTFFLSLPSSCQVSHSTPLLWLSLLAQEILCGRRLENQKRLSSLFFTVLSVCVPFVGGLHRATPMLLTVSWSPAQMLQSKSHLWWQFCPEIPVDPSSCWPGCCHTGTSWMPSVLEWGHGVWTRCCDVSFPSPSQWTRLFLLTSQFLKPDLKCCSGYQSALASWCCLCWGVSGHSLVCHSWGDHMSAPHQPWITSTTPALVFETWQHHWTLVWDASSTRWVWTPPCTRISDSLFAHVSVQASSLSPEWAVKIWGTTYLKATHKTTLQHNWIAKWHQCDLNLRSQIWPWNSATSVGHQWDCPQVRIKGSSHTGQSLERIGPASGEILAEKRDHNWQAS